MKWTYLEEELLFCPVDERYYWEKSNGWFKEKLDALNYLGEYGWELVAITNDYVYTFKRPVGDLV